MYVAAHAPDVGENESALGKEMPSAERGIVAGADKIINPDLERWYYARAGSRTVEIPGASRSVYESHPKEVASVIADAARTFEK